MDKETMSGIGTRLVIIYWNHPLPSQSSPTTLLTLARHQAKFEKVPQCVVGKGGKESAIQVAGG